MDMQKIIKVTTNLVEALHKCYRRIDKHDFIRNESELDQLVNDELIYVEVDSQRIFSYIGLTRYLSGHLFQDDEDPRDRVEEMLEKLNLIGEDVAAIIALGIDPAVNYKEHLRLLVEFAKGKYHKSALIMVSHVPFEGELYAGLKENGFQFVESRSHIAYYKYKSEGLARGLSW